ncbi:MAG: SDR family oxidoreductase [Actinomycetota bacterium]
MTAPLVLVTGASGNIGSKLVNELLDVDANVRVFVRDPAKSAHLDGRVQVAVGDFQNAPTVASALEGVDRAFLLAVDPKHEADFIEAAKVAGVSQLVQLSSGGVPFGVGSGPLHTPGEHLLKESGLNWTILRPWEYMSNSFHWLETIRSQSSIFEPTGQGKIAPIDPADISAVAARVLTSGGHEVRTYELTGQQLLNRNEMAELISAAIGRTVHFVDIPSETYKEQLVKMGMPEMFVEPVAGFYRMVNEGKLAIIHPDVENLLGRKARTYEQWLSVNAKAFEPQD